MEPIEEVLSAPQRIRVVLCGMGTPKEELLSLAALRAVNNGLNVTYINATKLGQTYVRQNFLAHIKDARLSLLTAQWMATLPRGHYDDGVNKLIGLAPDLIIMHDVYYHQQWSQKGVVQPIATVMKLKPATKLLIATVPRHWPQKPLAYTRLYRLCRQSELLPELISVWRWPTPTDLRRELEYYDIPPALLQEQSADWKDNYLE